MKTVICNVCGMTISESGLKSYNKGQEVDMDLASYGKFRLAMIVVSFEFNCTGFDLCQPCLDSAIAKHFKSKP